MPADITVVVGAQNAKSVIKVCLESILEQVTGLNAEIIVADSSTDGTNEIIAADFPSVKLLRADRSKLVPHLWGMGMVQANAPIVAITMGHCIPANNWIKSILSQAERQKGYAAIGGPIAPPEGAPAKDWAVYFSRYSAFMPPSADGPVKDIPGDNAAYRKEALDRCWTDRASGFWETLFHESLRKAGEQIYMTQDMGVSLGHTDSAWDYFNVRLKHGIHYGSTRPNNDGPIKIVRIFAAPLLMPYLVLRIGRRVAEKRPDWIPRYVAALPWLLFFMSGWSLGEIRGYMRAPDAAT